MSVHADNFEGDRIVPLEFIGVQTSSMNLECERIKRKEFKTRTKKKRIEFAKVKKERFETIANAIPEGVANIFTFRRAQKIKACALIYREKKGCNGRIFMLMNTNNPMILKFVKVNLDVEKQLFDTRLGHYALVYKDTNDIHSPWRKQNIPRNVLDKFSNFVKRKYIPSFDPDDFAYGGVTINAISRGNTWDFDIDGEEIVRDFINKQKDEDAEIEKINSVIEDSDSEGDMEFREWLRDSGKMDHNSSIAKFIRTSDAEPKKQQKTNVKKNKKMNLSEFCNFVHTEETARYNAKLCPKNMDNKVYPFGCCIKTCRYIHPEGWDFAEANRQFKAHTKLLKSLEPTVAQSGRQLINQGGCCPCRFGMSCRNSACMFVHPDQKCKHKCDVCNGGVCKVYQLYLEKR